MHIELSELWTVCGQGNTLRPVTVHAVIRVLDSSVVHVLQAVHALSGCDTTSKVGSKKSALKVAGSQGSLSFILEIID